MKNEKTSLVLIFFLELEIFLTIAGEKYVLCFFVSMYFEHVCIFMRIFLQTQYV